MNIRRVRVVLALAGAVFAASALPAQAGKAVPVYSQETPLCKTVSTYTVACTWKFSITGMRTGALGNKVSNIQYGNSSTVSCTVNLVSSTRTSSNYETPWCEATRTDGSDESLSYSSAIYDSRGRTLGGSGTNTHWDSAKCGTAYAYRVVGSGEMWSNAQAVASAAGGRLVWLDSTDKQACIAAFAGSGEYWIGATDTASEGNWTWIGGSLFCIGNNPCVAQGGAFTNWGGSEPNNNKPYSWSPGENCAGILTDYTWNDWPCDYSKAYIYEVPTS